MLLFCLEFLCKINCNKEKNIINNKDNSHYYYFFFNVRDNFDSVFALLNNTHLIKKVLILLKLELKLIRLIININVQYYYH